MSSYNHFGCSYCGGPFNGGNCPSCSSVGSGDEFVYDPNPYSYNETPNFFNQPLQYHYETYSCEFCGGNSHPGYDCQTGNTPVYEQDPCNNQIFSNDQSPYYSPDQPQQFDCCKDKVQCLSDHYTAPVTPPSLAYTPTPPVLATMEPLDTFLIGDEVISTIFERGNDEFIKSSVDDLVPIPRESELTLDNIDLLLREHLNTLSTGDREVDFNPSRDIEELERLLADDPVLVPRVFDEPLVTPLPDPRQICLREVERFDPFFSLTQSGGTTRVIETPSSGFHHMPSPCPTAYSPKEVMY
ncbi:hypothetical protein Tco_0953388 [Tanacetum coccineum]|uniref:Uncharacterized protein n=1 Tax=Tanacetum coccineum TaxID=301880 RepID=A0ABQ5E1N0_9ASTR